MPCSFRRFALAVAGVFVSLPSFAQSAACDLRGKTINFMKETCIEGGPTSGRCIYGSEKIKILGRTLFYYWDITQNVGVQYTLGETRDLLEGTDEIQRRMLLGNSPTALNTFMSVQGTASYSGGVLTVQQLRYRHTAVERVLKNPPVIFKPGDAISVDDSSISFAVEGSCSKCSIQDYHYETRVVRGGPTLASARMVNSSCTID